MAWTFYNSSGELQINDGGVSATAASITNDLTVTSGNVVMATAGKGIDFSAVTHSSVSGTSMGSEILDAYEEGTFTPFIGDDNVSASESQAYTYQFGRYVRIGKYCWISIRITLSSFGSLTTSQGVHVGGMPFTAVNVANTYQAFAVGNGSGLAATAGYNISAFIGGNTSYIQVHLWDGSLGSSGLLLSELSADGGFSIGGMYEIVEP